MSRIILDKKNKKHQAAIKAEAIRMLRSGDLIVTEISLKESNGVSNILIKAIDPKDSK